MARAQQDISSPFTFVKGLITEANKLNEPDNSASDMLNVEVDHKGTAKKRKGLRPEPLGVVVNSVIPSLDNAVAAIEWKNVNGRPNVNFLVLQAGTTLHFYNLDSSTISTAYIDSVDFSSVCVSVTSAAAAAIDGKSCSIGLICVNQYADPFIVIFDEDNNKFLLQKLVLKIRDFLGMPDGLRIDENPTTLSNPHFYNLMNQGWVEIGDSGLEDSTGSGTEGGSPSTGGGGTIDSGDNFGELELP